MQENFDNRVDIPDSSQDGRRGFGFEIVLPPKEPSTGVHIDTPLVFTGRDLLSKNDSSSDPIRQMRRLYEYGPITPQLRAKNFYVQGKFMENYEDSVPWTGDFLCYFPTYHDLPYRQLRGYFGWRTNVRKGFVQKVSFSAAYIYIYELLNGIGTASAADSLCKLKEFEKSFIDAGFGDNRMRNYLRRWMFELAVVKNVDLDVAKQYLPEFVFDYDKALGVLKKPSEHSSEEVFSSLFRLGGRRNLNSPVITNDPGKAALLFSKTWENAISGYKRNGRPLFDLCFGRRGSRYWYPLANAVYYFQEPQPEFEYFVSDNRAYSFKEGRWTEKSYSTNSFDSVLFEGFIRETDRILRKYYKTGRYLKEFAGFEWVLPFVQQAIATVEASEKRSSRPQVVIDVSILEKIRNDAITTRDSLLTEDERAEEENGGSPVVKANASSEVPSTEEINESRILDPVKLRIIRCLLQGSDPSDILKAENMMPSIAADSINEALYDYIGDVAVLCENGRLTLEEEYIEDITGLIGGKSDV